LTLPVLATTENKRNKSQFASVTLSPFA